MSEMIQKMRAEPEDGWDALWIKFPSLMGLGQYDYALECVDVLAELMKDDAGALGGEDYTVTVLRNNGLGTLAAMDLAARANMATIYLSDLFYSMQEP